MFERSIDWRGVVEEGGIVVVLADEVSRSSTAQPELFAD
jgi:hypothetical protein